MDDPESFLAGDRVDDVAFFLHEDVLDEPERLADHASAAGDGYVVVTEGTRGREAFQRATGIDPMALAGSARQREGTVAPDLAGGTCPSEGGGPHVVQVVFAFAEAQNEAAGGLYAEGDVIHAYARCGCGTAFSDRWVVGEA